MPEMQVLIWDVEAQPNRHAVLGAAPSRPDLVWLCLLIQMLTILFSSLLEIAYSFCLFPVSFFLEMINFCG